MLKSIESFINFKRNLLEKKFNKMNDMQKEAIFTVNGPVLILAGAGSGKTTIIVNRIAYLLEYGDAYFSEEGFEKFKEFQLREKNLNLENLDEDLTNEFLKANPPKAEEIVAITFTNKAAKELCERLKLILKEKAAKINAGTFHSQCIKILVKYIHILGYKNNFVIYDTNDSKQILKEIILSLNLNVKIYQPKYILYKISNAKNKFISPEEYEEKTKDLEFKSEISKIYRLYQNNLKNANALDFDDILCLTVKLLKENENILNLYQKKFKYIMVDEYQDTNYVQYELIKLLSGYYKNLCVVGDDDQSIYKFRGAAIENILNFEKQMQNVKTIKLEQNYRSTQNILSAANSVISKNSMRKNKKIWTSKKEGEKVKEIHIANENEEAKFVCETINQNVKNNMSYKDHAILYRMNAQSSNIEKFLIRNSIPYQIIGSTKFYDRKEVKDILAYLTLIDNSYDDINLTRIVNTPKRGIGTGTVSKIKKLSNQLNIPIYNILKNVENFSVLSSKITQLKEFYQLIEEFKNFSKNKTLGEIFDEIIDKTKYIDYLKEQYPNEDFRIENLKELKTNLLQFELENENATLSNFLFEISLYTDISEYNEDCDKVSLMTLHSAKGLEFPVVFMIGMEEGIFPSSQAKEKISDIEEERRLAYVGMTRAKVQLYLTYSSQRMIFGSTKYSKPSRFLNEIADEFKEINNKIVKKIQIEKKEKDYEISIEENIYLKKETPIEIDFAVNEFVLHPIFGEGLVKSITKLGNDHLVVVEFKTKGLKKVMANYAKLKKINN